MRSFFVFFFNIVVILILIAFGGLLLPSKVTVTKSVLINASPKKAAAQINDFDNWATWYPALQNKKVSVTGNTPKTNVLQSIALKDDNGKQIDLHLIQSSPDSINIEVKSQSSTKVFYQFLLIPHDNGKTQLTLNVNAYFEWYPWEKVKGIFLDKISGPQYESALLKLKEAAEK